MLEQLMCPPVALCALSLTDAMMDNLKTKFAWWRSLIKCCYLTEARKVSVMKTGEGGRENMQSHQSKQRAFQTFIVVTSTVWLSFAGLLVSNAVYWSPQVSDTVRSAVVHTCFTCPAVQSYLCCICTGQENSEVAL